ncbi:hypothetical protein [Thiothrix subterranea]|uniref:Uncharacterized protein n=1 Tax=Thiothrix subterranea TaxID=2735563 RepID=A0AA51MPM9_9GAMM|nr:hypothetical protein [Thiothrix subterranea]MDQ5771020.1 hypothetical protein [Thiothrix subterranea]WML85936.1 hypothetical protein RCG00_16735 [Thiothrix subterranea]
MFDLFFTVFPAVSVVFKLGFEPTEACFYELTAEQYEEAWRQGQDRGMTLYMVLSPQGKTQPGEVVVVSEAEKASLLKAAEVIELYCQKSGKVFDDYESKLRFVRNFLPPVFAKDTDFKQPHLSVVG